MEVTVNTENIPDEIVDYATDQLAYRLQAEPLEEVVTTFLDDYQNMEVSEDSDTLTFNKTLLTSVLGRAMDEKLSDIEWEVKHGQRDDYSPGDIRRIRAEIEEVMF